MVGAYIGTVITEDSMQIPQKFKTKGSYNPTIQGNEISTFKDTYRLMFTAASLTIAKVWKQPEDPLMD